MNCKGECYKYKAKNNILLTFLFKKKKVWCQLCNIFITEEGIDRKPNGLFCKCCGKKMTTKQGSLDNLKDLSFEEKQLIQKLLPFTGHKIKLRKNLYTTKIGKDPLKDFRMKDLLKKNGGNFNGQRVLDVGCLEGGFTMAATKFGAKEAVGIEARETHIQRCNLVKKLLKLNNLVFYHSNVKDIKKLNLGKFDVIICSGLLYHLDDPYLFLHEMYEILNSNGIMMIDTHVALEDVYGHRCESKVITKTFDSKNYRGRWNSEYSESATPDQIESYTWASHGNTKSFWPLKNSLEKMLVDVGFQITNEIERPPEGRICKQGHENCRIGFIVKKITN